VSRRKAKPAPPVRFAPIAIGLGLTLIHLVSIPVTNTSVNPARSTGVALFAGSLDLTTMNVLEKLFVLLAIGATPGDGRHYEFIRAWAAGLGDVLAGA